MPTRNGEFDVRIKFENIPIIDKKVNNIKELEALFKKLKVKLP